MLAAIGPERPATGVLNCSGQGRKVMLAGFSGLIRGFMDKGHGAEAILTIPDSAGGWRCALGKGWAFKGVSPVKASISLPEKDCFRVLIIG